MLINPEAIVIITSNISPWERRTGGKRQGKNGKTRRAKQKESHMQHTATSTVGFLKICDSEKVNRGRLLHISVFFRCNGNKVYKVLQGWLVILDVYLTLQNIALTWSDLQRLQKNGIMIWAATVLCTKVYEAFCAVFNTPLPSSAAWLRVLSPTGSSWHRWFLLCLTSPRSLRLTSNTI